jgi:hypothetical protein
VLEATEVAAHLMEAGEVSSIEFLGIRENSEIAVS